MDYSIHIDTISTIFVLKGLYVKILLQRTPCAVRDSGGGGGGGGGGF